MPYVWCKARVYGGHEYKPGEPFPVSRKPKRSMITGKIVEWVPEAAESVAPKPPPPPPPKPAPPPPVETPSESHATDELGGPAAEPHTVAPPAMETESVDAPTAVPDESIDPTEAASVGLLTDEAPEPEEPAPEVRAEKPGLLGRIFGGDPQEPPPDAGPKPASQKKAKKKRRTKKKV